MGSIQNFKELEIWQLGIQLVKAVYTTTHSFPQSEMYCLSNQMKRSAISTPSNIAEGFRRRSPLEFKRFLNIALGSLAELETQIIIAHELNYINPQHQKDLLETIDHINRKVANLYKRLQ